MPLAPLTVFGGWRMANHIWFRNADDDMDCIYETEGLDPTVFETEEACQQAIDEL